MSEQNPKPPEPLPPAPARRRRDRELWLGVFVIAGVIAILTGLFTLTDASTFRGRYVVTTSVGDAGGVRRGDPVELRGVHIGRVKEFEFSPEGVRIHLEIENEYRVPRDSSVRLKPSGLLGGMIVEVLPGTSEEPLHKGDSLPGSTGVPLSDAAERVVGESAALLERAQLLLSDRTIEGVETSSVELAELLKNVSEGVTEQRASLGELSRSLRRSAANLEGATGPELHRTVARLDALTRRIEGITPGIERTVASLESSSGAAADLLGRIQRGEGTLGRLSKDDALYVKATRTLDHLDRAAAELSLLSQDIRKNPGRYVKLSLF